MKHSKTTWIRALRKTALKYDPDADESIRASWGRPKNCLMCQMIAVYCRECIYNHPIFDDTLEYEGNRGVRCIRQEAELPLRFSNRETILARKAYILKKIIPRIKAIPPDDEFFSQGKKHHCAGGEG